MEFCNIVDQLPKHLKQFIVDQNYEAYTPIDHAVWRYVMGQNVRFLSKVAHGSYLDGLKRAGISLESIPSIYGMNRILKEIGWAAVTVDGFIPPNAFMEFQKYKVLVIAADIRQLKHIEYTPAPDIIHEAAGHAPIIADPEYAEYLRLFGEIGSKSFSSSEDYELYEAIRKLSILKEYPNSTAEEIKEVEKEIDRIQSEMKELSEMARIRNLHWWTVEYGLIGDINDPKIYGAGLLSSIGESYNCLKDHVKKIPYNIDAANQSFDITEEQPQLFVTPDFATLTNVLNEFADQMALRNGGVDGAHKAVDCSYRSTLVYDSGLQVSGNFISYKANGEELTFIKTDGPTALSYNDKVIDGHDITYHAHGFSSPVGKWKDVSPSPKDLSDEELKALGLIEGSQSKLVYESGFTIEGVLKGILRNVKGELMILSFDDCTATYQGETMFMPEWGTFDVAIGERIISAFQGAADADAFDPEMVVPSSKTLKIQYSDQERKLHDLFAELRVARIEGADTDTFETIYNIAYKAFPKSWLIFVELLEMFSKHENQEMFDQTLAHLNHIKDEDPSLVKLIDDGIDGIKAHFVYTYAQ